MWLAWRGQVSSPPPPTPVHSLVSEETAAREQLLRLAWRQERLRRTHLSITLRAAREWPSDELVRTLNSTLFREYARLASYFQPLRKTLAYGVPTWYCPPLVIDAFNAAAINTGDTTVELVVLQPLDMDYRDEDDSRRVFLLPLGKDLFQVIQVPTCSGEIPFTVLRLAQVRFLLGNGYRSVGRDGVVDYGRMVSVIRWESRHLFPKHCVKYFSLAVPSTEAARIARYATGRLLRHIRHLRPRGAVTSGWQYEDGATPKVWLLFQQRYSFNIRPERAVAGRLLPVGVDAAPLPHEGAVVDVSCVGEVLRIHVVGSNPGDFARDVVASASFRSRPALDHAP